MRLMSSDDNSNNDSGPSIEEYGVALSEKELNQIEADEEIRSKLRRCIICDIEFIDGSYFDEMTCGSRDCIEEYEKIYGRRKNRKKFHLRDLKMG